MIATEVLRKLFFKARNDNGLTMFVSPLWSFVWLNWFWIEQLTGFILGKGQHTHTHTLCMNHLISACLVAICWGSTNPLIKAGSAGLETVSRKYPDGGLKKWLAELKYLLTRWQVKQKKHQGHAVSTNDILLSMFYLWHSTLVARLCTIIPLGKVVGRTLQ